MPKISLFLLFLIGLVPAGIHATTVLPADLEAMTGTSDLIFHGTVLEVETLNLATPESPRIVTDVKFNVSRVLKGTTPGPQFTLRLFGGTWQGTTVHIPGSAAFKEAEEVVLFLEWTGQRYAVCGMKQGKYTIQRDQEGVRWARRSLAGLHVARRKENDTLEVRAAADLEPPLRLEELFGRIKKFKSE